MTRQQATEMVGLLVASYPQARMSGPNMRAFETMIIDLDWQHARLAVHNWVATHKWMPSIAEIREASFALEQGGSELTGAEAWGILLAAVRRVGSYEPEPDWPEPRIGEALRLFGSWRDFCLTPAHDAAGRARFIDHYDSLVQRRRAKQSPRLTEGTATAGLARGLAAKLTGGTDGNKELGDGGRRGGGGLRARDGAADESGYDAGEPANARIRGTPAGDSAEHARGRGGARARRGR